MALSMAWRSNWFGGRTRAGLLGVPPLRPWRDFLPDVKGSFANTNGLYLGSKTEGPFLIFAHFSFCKKLRL